MLINLKSFSWFTWTFQDNFRCIDSEGRSFTAVRWRPHSVLSHPMPIFITALLQAWLALLPMLTLNTHACTHTQNHAKSIPMRFMVWQHQKYFSSLWRATLGEALSVSGLLSPRAWFLSYDSATAFVWPSPPWRTLRHPLYPPRAPGFLPWKPKPKANKNKTKILKNKNK